jgi:hypothetical protein
MRANYDYNLLNGLQELITLAEKIDDALVDRENAFEVVERIAVGPPAMPDDLSRDMSASTTRQPLDVSMRASNHCQNSSSTFLPTSAIIANPCSTNPLLMAVSPLGMPATRLWRVALISEGRSRRFVK